MAHMKVVDFQGDSKANTPPSPPMSLPPVTNLDLTPSPDVPLAILKRKMMASNDIKVSRGLLMEINNHLKVETKQVFNCRQQLHGSGSQVCLFSGQTDAGRHHVPGSPEGDRQQAEDGKGSERTSWPDPARVLPGCGQPLQAQLLQLAQTGGRN